jgi:predicted transport protein
LVKYFGIESNESNNDEKVQNNEDDYVKQEINVDNRVKKNSNEELKYYLEPPKYFKNLFRKIETIILRQHMSVQKEQMPESYKYTLFGNRVCYVNFRNKYLNLYFNIPYGEMEDKKGLLEKNNSHQVHVPYKLKVDNTVSLEDIESYIIQAFNYYK